MAFDPSTGLNPGQGFATGVEEVGARSARVAQMLWHALDAVQSTSTAGHDFLQSLDTEDHLPERRQYAQSGLWKRIQNLSSYTCGRAMKALRRLQRERESTLGGASEAEFAGGNQKLDNTESSFREFFMEAVAGACEGDLDRMRKDEQLTESSVAQLVACLEGGTNVFGDLEKQVCCQLQRPKRE